MHIRTFSRSVICLAVVSTLYACGGSGGGSSLTTIPETLNVNVPPNTQTPAINSGGENSISESSISESSTGESSISENSGATLTGRVADGYIRGATVCIDMNENGVCDPDEPTAVTGQGGLYELAMVEDAEGKPILADIPATAIDEDDNKPVGKRMMFSAPPSKREFISPITTLVQQQLENNPSIDLNEAEAAVKEELGFSLEDEDASLFTDYVAHGDDADLGDKAERFRHMHRTAQVVARMMQEIQGSAEAAAVEQGIDIEGDPATRKALHTAVQKEIRKMLPEIAQAVSDRVLEEQVSVSANYSASVRANASAEADTAVQDSFDPNQLAARFIPTDSLDPADVIAERDLPRIQEVTVEAMLKEGFYWFDVHCGPPEYYDEVVSWNNAESVDGRIAAPAFDCAAAYTHIVLADDGQHIQQTDYEYSDVSGGWEAYSDSAEESDHMWHLVEGAWVVPGADTDASVEFTEDGGAIIEHSDGEMVIMASQRSLASQPLAHRLFDLAGEVMGDRAALFPAEASEYLFKIKRKDSQYALFNWQGEIDGDCAEFNGNCNIVNQVSDSGLKVIESLDTIVDGEEIVLTGLLHDFTDRSLDVKLYPLDADADWGQAKWITGTAHPEAPECVPYEYEELPEGIPVDMFPTVVPPEFTNGVIDQLPSTLAREIGSLQLLNDEAMDSIPTSLEGSICYGPLPALMHDSSASDSAYSSSSSSSSSSMSAHALTEVKPIDSHGFGYGRWRTVEVDGVKMVELTLPFALRHRVDFDESASVMLIEHQGFVRRGAHFSDRSVDTETAYNPAAFEALLNEVESFIKTDSPSLR